MRLSLHPPRDPGKRPASARKGSACGKDRLTVPANASFIVIGNTAGRLTDRSTRMLKFVAMDKAGHGRGVAS
jgi:hypothetical protein